MTALWSTSPITSAPTTMPVTRRALIDDRHQRQPEAHDPHATREEIPEAPPREEMDVGGELLARGAEMLTTLPLHVYGPYNDPTVTPLVIDLGWR